ncbi:YSC84-related protein [Actibacterium ureilyticum]|uniref:lipid-binding SYLF domain-containing protein n=1 Tax=Actibacterium ureilyticum TaxID=1590614 RepID=UPI000BAAE083|nr:YSC84-related protein [Actibacterium ureilyticum]
MSTFSRRSFLMAAGATTALTAACGNGVGSQGGARIDARVDSTRDFLFSRYPGTVDLSNKAQGILWMPLITEAGFGVGGSYGRGALRINDVTVDYYSATQASFGLQIGAQQYAHALFFMTAEALSTFRRSPGWSAGADLEYALNDEGGNVSAETLTALDPVVAVVFGQAGLLAGASVEGTKYSRIIP